TITPLPEVPDAPGPARVPHPERDRGAPDGTGNAAGPARGTARSDAVRDLAARQEAGAAELPAVDGAGPEREAGGPAG
ncbi:hypothetical protein ACSNOI_32350, partial [Actinomadura kijaniata]|uniref:hypothetical protein n=1 Tax=Actinomadura kijaniata TaxID=46161 RepID=UPI003F1CEAD2